MKLGEQLAAKALVARKQKEADNKAIADDRRRGREAAAKEVWDKLQVAMNKAASGGYQSYQQSFVGCIDDDPVIKYLGVRCREEGITMTLKSEPDAAQISYEFSWGGGE